MSVRVADRGESKYAALVKAEELVEHTIHIISNENIFNPQYKCLNNKIIDAAVDVGCCIYEATDAVRSKCSNDHQNIYNLLNKAIRSLNVLLFLMTIARRLNHLRTAKYEYWSSLAKSTKNMIIDWKNEIFS